MSERTNNLRNWVRRGTAIAVYSAVLALAGCSAMPELPATKPADLTFDVGLTPDFATDMQACLTERGWAVSLGTDGSFITDNIPNGQRDVYFADEDDCRKQLGYDQPPPALSDDQVREAYQHGLWDWKCLDENGYSPDPPPSEQTFVDGYHATITLWSPFSQYTATLPQDDLGQLFSECPRSY